MANPVSKAGFPDVLDPRFREITFQTFQEQKDMIPFFYDMVESNLDVERGSDITPMGDLVEFTGTLTYDAPSQGYDWRTAHKEFALGTSVERRVWRFDQFGVIENIFTELARSAFKTRQKHGARMFNNAFTNDTGWWVHTEAVALCSNSHTTTRSGVSTSSGFDNLNTAALSPTSLGAAITNFRKFKDLAGESINVVPDLLLVPVDLRDRASEIIKTTSGLDTAEGNINVYNSDYNFKVADYVYLSDANDWYLIDSKFMKRNLKWYDADPVEFARVESFDEIIAKYRAYTQYAMSYGLWQFILGSQVS